MHSSRTNPFASFLIVLSVSLLVSCAPEADGSGRVEQEADQNIVPALVPYIPAEMQKVYESISLSGLRTDQQSYQSGELVIVSYQWANKLDEELVVPANSSLARPYFLLGGFREWVEREGEDSVIDALPAWTVRQDDRYSPAGGLLVLDFVPGRYELEPGEVLPVSRILDTAGFPPGRYRYTVQYQTLVDDDREPQVLQEIVIEFDLK